MLIATLKEVYFCPLPSSTAPAQISMAMGGWTVGVAEQLPHLTDQSSQQNVPTAVPKISSGLISETAVTVYARTATEIQDALLPQMISCKASGKAESVGRDSA